LELGPSRTQRDPGEGFGKFRESGGDFQRNEPGKKKLEAGGTEWPPILFHPGDLTVNAYRGGTLATSRKITVTDTTSMTLDLDPLEIKQPSSNAPKTPLYDPAQPDTATASAVTNAAIPPKDTVSVSVAEEPIDVWVQSNCDEVELFVNGASAGRRKISPNSHAQWEKIP